MHPLMLCCEFHFAYLEKIYMQRRAGMLFATTALIFIVLAACRTRTGSVEDDKKAAINVVLAHEQAVQEYDLDKVDSLHMPDARVIEESYPHPFEPGERQGWQEYKDAGVHVEYHPRDAVAEVRGDVAWVTVTLPSSWRADTPAGRVMLGGSTWRATYEESFILVKTPAGWKIDFRHTTILPADFGVEPDYQQEHGGMKFAKVPEDGPAGKAGLKSGDVLIECGGQKIDNPDDLYRLRYSHYEGEKVMVTVMRGHEKITKEVTLEQMR
jgi:ketosteroid isomerase-like protein